jgi:hypothetical protein
MRTDPLARRWLPTHAVSGPLCRAMDTSCPAPGSNTASYRKRKTASARVNRSRFSGDFRRTEAIHRYACLDVPTPREEAQGTHYRVLTDSCPGFAQIVDHASRRRYSVMLVVTSILSNSDRPCPRSRVTRK